MERRVALESETMFSPLSGRYWWDSLKSIGLNPVSTISKNKPKIAAVPSKYTHEMYTLSRPWLFQPKKMFFTNVYIFSKNHSMFCVLLWVFLLCGKSWRQSLLFFLSPTKLTSGFNQFFAPIFRKTGLQNRFHFSTESSWNSKQQIFKVNTEYFMTIFKQKYVWKREKTPALGNCIK